LRGRPFSWNGRAHGGTHVPNPRHAIGFVAVLLWASLALFTVGSAPVPPFQLNALCFAIGGGIGLIWVWRSGDARRLRKVSWRVYAFGTAGLFGYHALYFSALRLAPPAEAGLIAYLWPLLIVCFPACCRANGWGGAMWSAR
jgi:drug/metabolite transporter (DMT)-like permease